MRLRNTSHPSRVFPLLAGILGGVVSLALDFDHVPVLWWRNIPITLDSLSTEAARPFHIPALLGAAAFLSYRLAHTYRLLVAIRR